MYPNLLKPIRAIDRTNSLAILILTSKVNVLPAKNIFLQQKGNVKSLYEICIKNSGFIELPYAQVYSFLMVEVL